MRSVCWPWEYDHGMLGAQSLFVEINKTSVHSCLGSFSRRNYKLLHSFSFLVLLLRCVALLWETLNTYNLNVGSNGILSNLAGAFPLGIYRIGLSIFILRGLTSYICRLSLTLYLRSQRILWSLRPGLGEPETYGEVWSLLGL